MRIHVFSAKEQPEHMKLLEAISQYGTITISGKCEPCDICIFLTEPTREEMIYGPNIKTYFYVTCDLLFIHAIQYKNNEIIYRKFDYILLPESFEYQRSYLSLLYKGTRIISIPDIYDGPVCLNTSELNGKEISLVMRQKEAKVLFHLIDDTTIQVDTLYWVNADMAQKDYNRRFRFADKIRYLVDMTDDDILKKFLPLNHKVIFLEHNAQNSLHLRLQFGIHKYVLTNRDQPYAAHYTTDTFASQLTKLAASDIYEYSNKALQYGLKSTKLNYIESFLKNVPFTQYLIIVIGINDERMEFISKQIDDLKISIPVLFLNASTPSNSKEFLNDTYGNEKPHKKDYFDKMQCCFKSHVECLKIFQQYNEIPYLIVLEDDVILSKDFEAQLSRIVESYESNKVVDFVSIGYLPIKETELTKFHTDGRLYWSKEKVWGTQALLYNHAAAKKALSVFDKPTAKDIVAATKTFVKDTQGNEKGYPDVWCGPDTILNIVLKQAIVWPPIAIESPSIKSSIWEANREARLGLAESVLGGEPALKNYYSL